MCRIMAHPYHTHDHIACELFGSRYTLRAAHIEWIHNQLSSISWDESSNEAHLPMQQSVSLIGASFCAHALFGILIFVACIERTMEERESVEIRSGQLVITGDNGNRGSHRLQQSKTVLHRWYFA